MLNLINFFKKSKTYILCVCVSETSNCSSHEITFIVPNVKSLEEAKNQVLNEKFTKDAKNITFIDKYCNVLTEIEEFYF